MCVSATLCMCVCMRACVRGIGKVVACCFQGNHYQTLKRGNLSFLCDMQRMPSSGERPRTAFCCSRPKAVLTAVTFGNYVLYIWCWGGGVSLERSEVI